jgi:hypothetical protein
MTIELYTTEKLTAVVKQIENLLLSDFPHESTRTGLELFATFFNSQITRVKHAGAQSERSLLIRTCTTANARIAAYLPLLGFMLRSTNVRNNFESYDSLLQLAQRLIGQQAKVVISSEWDLSPLTYALSVPVLPGYVLLGMPATESSNALLLPLTGHELGHSVWTNENLENKWAANVEQKIREYLIREKASFHDAFPAFAGGKIDDQEFSTDMFLKLTVEDISPLILGQMEETFCDAVGLKIFGDSFVQAFHYLLAPGFGVDRSLFYPPLPTRAKFMVAHGGLDFHGLGYSDFPLEFQEQQPNLSRGQEFISRAADEIAEAMAADLYVEATNRVRQTASDLMPDKSAQAEILTMFKRGIPSRHPRSLSDILNAGWEFVRTEGKTHDSAERPLFEWISELVLKSIEVLEFRRRLKDA